MSAKAFDKFVNSNLAFLNQPMWAMILGASISLYAGLAAPLLPPSILNLFDNGLVRLAFLSLIMWTSTQQPTLALVTAVAFVMVLNALSGRKLLELFEGHIAHSNAAGLGDEDEFGETMVGDSLGMPSPIPTDIQM